MATPTVGSQADITLLNVTVAELSPDNVWARIELEPDANNQVVSVWIPIDTRVNVVPSVPANWPPLEMDVWGLTGTTTKAWVVSDGAGNLYFVTEQNIRKKTTPISVAQALAVYGSKLELMYRPTA